MIAEMLTFFRGFLSGVFVGLCLAAGGLLLGMYWLLDTDKRLTPLSMGQRPASGGQGPVSVPENWPASLKTFLERSMEPDPDTDYLLPPVTLPKRKGNAAEPGSSTGTKANPSNSSNSKDTPSDSGTVYVSPTLDVSWANILLARFFLMLRESELYKQKTASKMNAKMNAKLQSNSFMQSVLVTDIDLGDHSPKALGIRLIKGVSSDYAVLCEVDIVYEGGASIALEATLAGGIRLPVRIYLNDLAGKARIRWPSYQWSDMLGMAFVEDPGVSFTIDAPLSAKTSETVRGMVNRLLENLARKLFLEMWVLPSWRTFYMPLVNPSFEEQQVRRMKSTAAVGGPSFRSALATKAATLWEARANPLLKFRLTADLDLFSAHQFMFSTDSVIEELDPTELDSMQDILMSAFLDLAKSSNEASATVPQSNSTTAAPSTSKDSTPTLDSEPTDMGITTNKWKLFKKKPGVEMFKQSIAIEEKTTELVKSVIDIDCDVHRVFSVLSNPNHFRHVTETFMDSQLLQQVDDVKSIRRLRFQLGRGTRTATVFHLKKSLSETSFVVICRSVHFKSVLEDQGDAGGQGTGGGDDASSVGGYDSDVPSIDGGSTSILRKKSSEDILGSVKPRLRRRSMTNLKDDSVNESTPTSRQSSPVREPNAHTRIQSESSGLFQREPSTMSIKSSTSKQNSPVKTGGRTRSASGGKLLDSPSMSDAPSNITVYIFGYLIEPNPTDPNKSRVTLLSSVGSNLAKVTNTITFPSKLKDFIEELVTLTATLSGHDLQDLMEMRRPDARGGRVEKLKSYIGATASYLMKGYAKAKTGKEDLDGETQDGESPAVTDRSVDDRTPTSTVDEELLDPVPEPFNGEEYVDRELDLRQIVRVPLPYLAKPYNQSEPVLVDLTWEFSTRKELPIFFGIEFNPLDGDDDDKLLNRRYDKLASGNYAVIPLCQVSAYAKPICGKLIINDFPSGTFDFIYDNLSPPKRAIRQLTTRAWIQETPQRRFSSISSLDLVPKPLSEYHAEVTVPRKSFYKISFILDSKMEPFIDPSSRIMLSWTLLTGGYDVNLVIFYEEERGAGVTKGQNSSPEQIIPDDDDDDRDVKLRDSKDSPSSTGQSDTIPLDISPGENPDKLVAMSQQGMSSADVPPRLPPRPNATTPESPNRSTVEGRSRVSDDSSSIRSLSPRRRNDEIGEVPQSPKPGSGPASKFAQYLGKAKEVYRDVRTGVVASPVGSQSATTGASASGQTQGKLEQRAKAALSSRLQAVVSKSEDVSRRLKGAYVESRRPSSGPSEASPSEDPLSPSPAVFGLSPQSLTVFPLTKVNTKSSVSFRGSLDLSGGKGKWGLYTLVLDNTGSLLAAKTVTLSVMLGAQYNDGDLLFSNGENDGDVPIGNAIDESL